MKKSLVEIALVGIFQCGKSTLFNALLGRENLSLSGKGIKTSACAITARPLEDAIQEEYAEVKWRSPEMMKELVEAEDGREVSPYSGERDIEKVRVATLIKQVNDSEMLADLRQLRKMSIEAARRLSVYPSNWKSRLCRGEEFDLREVLFLFIERITFHLRNRELEALDCELTDTPGFDMGIWDETLAREVMLRADLLLFVVECRSRTMSEKYKEMLDWLKKYKCFSQKRVMFVLNSYDSREVAKRLRGANLAQLSQAGVSLSVKEMPIINAFLGYYARLCQSKERNKIDQQKKDAGRVLCSFLDLTPGIDNEKLLRYSKSPSALFNASGCKKVAEKLIAFVKNCSGQEAREEPLICIDESGTMHPLPGYSFEDGSTFITRLEKGLRWHAGLEHSQYAHVIAMQEEGAWEPEAGYGWIDEEDNDSCEVEWMSGKMHPANPHVIAMQEEGQWEPEAGYGWVDEEDNDSFEVEWMPGKIHPANPHVIAMQEEGQWEPEAGYGWVDEEDNDSFEVEWVPGKMHPANPHVIAMQEEGQWEPEIGYKWLSEEELTVKWEPGQSTADGFVADVEEGKWVAPVIYWGKLFWKWISSD